VSPTRKRRPRDRAGTPISHDTTTDYTDNGNRNEAKVNAGEKPRSFDGNINNARKRRREYEAAERAYWLGRLAEHNAYYDPANRPGAEVDQ
jgi:hypothetical protein